MTYTKIDEMFGYIRKELERDLVLLNQQGLLNGRNGLLALARSLADSIDMTAGKDMSVSKVRELHTILLDLGIGKADTVEQDELDKLLEELPRG